LLDNLLINFKNCFKNPFRISQAGDSGTENLEFAATAGRYVLQSEKQETGFPNKRFGNPELTE